MSFARLALVCAFVCAGSVARAQASDDGGTEPDMSVPACNSDSDCAATPGTPRCCVGSSCTPANVCVACIDYAGNPCVPVACDGALCATDNGAACSVGTRGGGGGRSALVVVLVAFALIGLVRRRRRALPTVVLLAALALPAPARGEAEPAVDVRLQLPPPPHRIMSLSYNPLELIFGKVSIDAVIVPRSHHALVLSPFYVTTTTAPIYVFDDMGHPTQLTAQSFRGAGAELGYRYYFGQQGPRGFYLGPSVVLAWMQVTAGNGSETNFLHYGFAADAGYQLLIADRVSLSLGAGLQVVLTDKSIPKQQFPARFYANEGVAPRVNASLGVAF